MAESAKKTGGNPALQGAKAIFGVCLFCSGAKACALTETCGFLSLHLHMLAMMEPEDKAGANSELRYIALELTKIAMQKKKPFRAVAGEYVQNVYELESMLREITSKKETVRSKRSI
jgi:hypothetical protein